MKLLIAEDDKTSRDLLREILAADRSTELKEAVDGAEAWALLEQGWRPDLCIFDIMMPNLDGLELLKKMRDDPRFKSINVILCTALNDRTTVTRAAALSVNYFLLKPYAREAVLAQVQKVKQSLSLPRRLDSPTMICERLAIGLSSYSTLLRSLTEEVPKTIHSIEKGTAEGDLKSPLLKLNALKGAGTRLGANGLVNVIGGIETDLTKDAPSSNTSEAEKTEQLCRWAGLHHKRILDQLDELKTENRFLTSELEFLTGPASPAVTPQTPQTPQTPPGSLGENSGLAA